MAPEKFNSLYGMFMGPCIVIYFYSKTNGMRNFLSLFNITYPWRCMYSLWLLMIEGKAVRNMQSDIKYTQKIVHLVGFTIEIYSCGSEWHSGNRPPSCWSRKSSCKVRKKKSFRISEKPRVCFTKTTYLRYQNHVSALPKPPVCFTKIAYLRYQNHVSALPKPRVCVTKTTCLLNQNHVSALPKSRVCVTKTTCLLYQNNVSALPKPRVCVTKTTCLRYQNYVSALPKPRICVTKTTCLLYQNHVSALPKPRTCVTKTNGQCHNGKAEIPASNPLRVAATKHYQSSDPDNCTDQLTAHWDQGYTNRGREVDRRTKFCNWHSCDRASSYILIIKDNKMRYFSTLFW